MKNIATGLLLFTAGVAVTLFFTNGYGKNLISQLDNLTGDAEVDENDIEAAVNRVEEKFREAHVAA